MKNLIALLIGCSLFLPTFGQSPEKTALIEMGRAYKDYMFAGEADKKFLKSFNKQFPKSLKTEANFIRESITTDNDLLNEEFLQLPEESTLKNIYIIRELNLLLREESDVSPAELVDSLEKSDIPRYEMVNNYYSMLFTGIGNKNKPFDFSGVNFQLNELGLVDETEKGIFFLRCINLCAINIWGYMNVVKPPNTAKAFEYIKKYPSINGKPYYRFTDLYFNDFEMVINKDDGKESYKAYYLNKYFELLLSHLIVLDREGGSQEEIRDLLLTSIMKDESLYKYTEYKKTLESIFQKQE